jgi:hypothetical protein
MSRRSRTVRKSAAKSSIPKYADGDDAEDYGDFKPYAARSYVQKRRIIYDEEDYDYYYYSDSECGPVDESERNQEWAERQDDLEEQRFIRNNAARVIQAWWRNARLMKKLNNAARVIQEGWRRAFYCPDYDLARRRLKREFLEMEREFLKMN